MKNIKYGAEESILKLCSINKELASNVLSGLERKDFSNELNREIYDAVINSLMDGSVKDEITFINSLKTKDAKELATRIYEHNIGQEKNIREYYDNVKEESNKRKLDELLCNAKASVKNGEDITKVLLSTNDQLNKIVIKQRDYKLETLGSVYNQLKDEIGTEAYLNKLHCIGLPEITKRFGKVMSGSIVVVAARPSMGKTAALIEAVKTLSISTNYKKRSLVFSLETDMERLTHRIISNLTGIPLCDLKRPNLEKEKRAQILAQAKKFEDAQVKFADTFDTSIHQIEAVCRREKANHPDLKYVFIDYVQLIDAGFKNPGSNRNAEISFISRKLQLLARELGLVIVILAQLSRECERRPDKRPILSDLRDSGQIEQDATMCIFMYRDEYYNKNTADKGLTEFIVRKNKDGPVGTLKMRHQLECNKYEPYEGADWDFA